MCVDLFCGAGGLTHGLIDAGLKVRAGVDFEEACRHPTRQTTRGSSFTKLTLRSSMRTRRNVIGDPGAGPRERLQRAARRPVAAFKSSSEGVPDAGPSSSARVRATSIDP